MSSKTQQHHRSPNHLNSALQVVFHRRAWVCSQVFRLFHGVESTWLTRYHVPILTSTEWATDNSPVSLSSQWNAILCGTLKKFTASLRLRIPPNSNSSCSLLEFHPWGFHEPSCSEWRGEWFGIIKSTLTPHWAGAGPYVPCPTPEIFCLRFVCERF